MCRVKSAKQVLKMASRLVSSCDWTTLQVSDHAWIHYTVRETVFHQLGMKQSIIFSPGASCAQGRKIRARPVQRRPGSGWSPSGGRRPLRCLPRATIKQSCPNRSSGTSEEDEELRGSPGSSTLTWSLLMSHFLFFCNIHCLQMFLDKWLQKVTPYNQQNWSTDKKLGWGSRRCVQSFSRYFAHSRWSSGRASRSYIASWWSQAAAGYYTTSAPSSPAVFLPSKDLIPMRSGSSTMTHVQSWPEATRCYPMLCGVYPWTHYRLASVGSLRAGPRWLSKKDLLTVNSVTVRELWPNHHLSCCRLNLTLSYNELTGLRWPSLPWLISFWFLVSVEEEKMGPGSRRGSEGSSLHQHHHWKADKKEKCQLDRCRNWKQSLFSNRSLLLNVL